MKNVLMMAALAGLAILQTGVSSASQFLLEPVRCPIDGKDYAMSAVTDQWSDAEKVARRATFRGKKGRLAQVTSPSVRNWLVAKFGRKPGYVYLGGVRLADGPPNVGWRWVDGPAIGAPISMSPVFWRQGEPNNFKGREKVVSMNFNYSGLFEDVSPNGRYNFLVEFN